MKSHRHLWKDGPVQGFLELEKKRLEEGVTAEEIIQGHGVDSYRGVAKGKAAASLERVMQLMRLVNSKGLEGNWPSANEWRRLLPDWFVEQCLPETTKDGHGPKRSKPEKESWMLLDPWTFSVNTWQMSMAPASTVQDEREWLWWDAKIKDPDTVIIGIDRLSDMLPEYPPEFIWMLQAAGLEVEATLPNHLDEHLLLMPGEERD